MFRPFTLALAFAIATPGLAQLSNPALNLEQTTALRCSAAFALVAQMQEQGDASQYPLLEERGREFFVRSIARVMDETGATREQVVTLMAEQVEGLSDQSELDAAMPPCLLLLEASGL